MSGTITLYGTDAYMRLARVEKRRIANRNKKGAVYVRGKWHVLLQGEEGQSLVEYSFILLFIALATVVSLRTVGVSVHDFLTDFVARWP